MYTSLSQISTQLIFSIFVAGLTVEEGCVKIGDYIVIQRQDQTKLHKVTLEYVSLGKDKIDFSIIIGKPVWKTYKMIPKRFAKREYYLVECPNTEYMSKELIKNISSLNDDGKTQHSIDRGNENSKSYHNKFIRRKEKRYYDDKHYYQYVTVRWPTIRLITEIMFRYDPGKIMGLRMDTISQILTAAGVQSGGTYIVYENRCEGLVVAAVLNTLTEGGHLIHVHPSNFAQDFAVNAMNFKSEQMARVKYANVNNLLMKLVQRTAELEQEKDEKQGSIEDDSKSIVAEGLKEKGAQDNENNTPAIGDSKQKEESTEDKKEDNSTTKKRKYTDDDEFAIKKARWNFLADQATNILLPSKADGLILIAREHPGNILNSLLPYVAASRSFVVFCPCLEPLLEVYVQLKSQNNTIGLRVTETFLRRQHISTNATQPDAWMSGGGGYLLTGLVVNSESVQPDPEG